eukprot:gnl/Dysnectes_brevis/6214_a9473_334.p2 GENE.gnl/Dysnectes_brevis/6214_a9473_334~~gnl/Dysnectes_brevis/6214_a9473_334.p2  ORF type:complete len:246 (+),score=38.81 gnl/Dysnectes_brevis/6214_a9473_334:1229-1966(+)
MNRASFIHIPLDSKPCCHLTRLLQTRSFGWACSKVTESYSRVDSSGILTLAQMLLNSHGFNLIERISEVRFSDTAYASVGRFMQRPRVTGTAQTHVFVLTKQEKCMYLSSWEKITSSDSDLEIRYSATPLDDPNSFISLTAAQIPTTQVKTMWKTSKSGSKYTAEQCRFLFTATEDQLVQIEFVSARTLSDLRDKKQTLILDAFKQRPLLGSIRARTTSTTDVKGPPTKKKKKKKRQSPMSDTLS